jgi:hypothetical protein
MTGGAAHVQIVVCMDTEGPCADPSNPTLLADWPLVDAATRTLFDEAFRNRHRDPSGGRLTFGWFFLTWTGFTTNPRGRAMGYHAVRDHYLSRWGDHLRAYGDEQCWHYHHPARSGVGNEWGLDWTICREYDAIISRQILERQWFPVCYRAGGTIMDPVSSRWVDAWFPFDYSNRAPLTIQGLVDWSTGVSAWDVYQPSPEDFRRPGAGRRRMARSLDLQTIFFALTDDEIAAAFERAAAGRPAVLSCFDHDYRDIAPRLDELRGRVAAIARRFPGVTWQYAAPVEAIRRFLGASAPTALTIDACTDGDDLSIVSSAPLYQAIPWLAVRCEDGTVHHVEEGVHRVDEWRWQWTPAHDLAWTQIGVAGSTDLGASAVALVERRADRRFIARPTPSAHPRSIWDHSSLFLELCEGRISGELPTTDSVAQAAEILRPHHRPGDTLLDVGCAAGHARLTFEPLGIAYAGIDSCAAAIEIGRRALEAGGRPADLLRTLALEDLPVDACYDIVLCLNTLYYFPMFHQPLEIMARAARRWLVVRSSFDDRMDIRYLPDTWLEPGSQTMRAYFSIFARADVQAFLESEGFSVRWVEDRRQRDRFGGQPEVVCGIALPAEFLIAERIAPPPSSDAIWGDRFPPETRGRPPRGAHGR